MNSDRHKSKNNRTSKLLGHPEAHTAPRRRAPAVWLTERKETEWRKKNFTEKNFETACYPNTLMKAT